MFDGLHQSGFVWNAGRSWKAAGLKTSGYQIFGKPIYLFSNVDESASDDAHCGGAK
ncbi:MAG: hypothetical protein ABEJ56_05840 [Candidatus Nanohaloarchaea archaeon]